MRTKKPKLRFMAGPISTPTGTATGRMTQHILFLHSPMPSPAAPGMAALGMAALGMAALGMAALGMAAPGAATITATNLTVPTATS